MSAPAPSTVRADGASYAVTMTRGVSVALAGRDVGRGHSRRARFAVISATSTVQGTFGSRQCHQRTGGSTGSTSGGPELGGRMRA